MAWKKMCVKPKSDKGLLPKICKELITKQELIPCYAQKPILWHYLSEKKKLYWWIGIARRQKALKSVSDSGFWVKFNE